MHEYRFAVSDSEVEPGRTVFMVENEGETAHELTLEALPPDFPPIDEQLRSDTRRVLPTLALLRPREPGTGDAFAVDLVPGRYALVCFLEDDDGVQHSLKGMATEIRVES